MQTNKDIYNLVAGTYDLTITDANGCTITSSSVISEPNEMLVSNVTTDVTCFGENDGAIDLTISGGTMPYAFMWTSAHQIEDIAGIFAGTYGVEIMDANSCAKSDTFTITQPSTQVIADFSQDADTVYLSNGGSVQFTNMSAGSSSYSWDFGDSSGNSSVGHPLHSYTSAGVYNVTLVSSDGNNCNSVATSTLVVIDDTQLGIEDESGLDAYVSFGNENGTAFIDFKFTETKQVILSVLNILGQEILPKRQVNVAKERIMVHIDSESTGIYFLTVEVDGEKTTHKYIF